MTVHIVKLAVGVENVSHMAEIQAKRLRDASTRGDEPILQHFTRNGPRRAAELLDGGSIYWVIKGFIRARQALIGIERGENAEGRPACALVMDTQLVRTRLRASRPFQGWRYLAHEAAPQDSRGSDEGLDAVPTELIAELKGLGLL